MQASGCFFFHLSLPQRTAAGRRHARGSLASPRAPRMRRIPSFGREISSTSSVRLADVPAEMQFSKKDAHRLHKPGSASDELRASTPSKKSCGRRACASFVFHVVSFVVVVVVFLRQRLVWLDIIIVHLASSYPSHFFFALDIVHRHRVVSFSGFPRRWSSFVRSLFYFLP